MNGRQILHLSYRLLSQKAPTTIHRVSFALKKSCKKTALQGHKESAQASFQGRSEVKVGGGDVRIKFADKRCDQWVEIVKA